MDWVSGFGLFYVTQKRIKKLLMKFGFGQSLGFDVEISSSNTPPRELYRIILSESNDKT